MPLSSMFRYSKQRFVVAGHEAGVRNGINGSGLRTDCAFFDFPRSEIIFEERFCILRVCDGCFRASFSPGCFAVNRAAGNLECR